MIEQLNRLYPGKVVEIRQKKEIPADVYMVYILGFNNSAIVVGRGKRNRAAVITDDINHITTGHVKALAVRAYVLYGAGLFSRFIIQCESKAEASNIERHLHMQIGGNTLTIPIEIRENLFKGVDPDSTAYLALQIALLSYYDGLSDLKKWRDNSLLKDEDWNVICRVLNLDKVKRFASP